jgi:hypothetical protein
LLGYGIEETAIESGIERHAQLAVIVVAEGNEAERLQTGALKFARRVQHYCHAVDCAGAGVEGDLDKISGRELVLQLQQSAVDGNGLEFGARPLAAFGHDCGGYGSVEVNAGRTLIGIGKGEVGHTKREYATVQTGVGDYESA